MNCEIWLAGFTVLSIISKQRISPYSPICDLDYSVEGMKTLNCSFLDPENLYTSIGLREGAENKDKLEVIYIAPIEPHKNLSVDIMAIDYHDVPNLKQIIIRNNPIITLSTIKYDFQKTYTIFYRHILQRVFEGCDHLEVLEISNSYFYDVIQFVLPKKLKIYIVEKNLYTAMRIHGSDELVELNANDNPLINVPLITKEKPPLKTLRLKRCPLQNMTIIDIAPLCELSLLELEFPNDNRMVNLEGYCNCTILNEWAKEVELKIDKVKCYEPKTTENIACPSAQYLDKAREIRKNKLCTNPRNTIASILLYVFFSVLCLLLLAALILFIIRRRQYHLNNSASITMAEAEETLNSSSAEGEEEEEV